MTVEQLIEELKRMQPFQPVRLLVRSGCEDCGQVEGGLSDVRFEGNFISLEADDV